MPACPNGNIISSVPIYAAFTRSAAYSISNNSPTDCSDYFDDGREWWGTYFWTIYSPQNGLYTGIMGSATD